MKIDNIDKEISFVFKISEHDIKELMKELNNFVSCNSINDYPRIFELEDVILDSLGDLLDK